MAAFTCNVCGAGFENGGCDCDARPENGRGAYGDDFGAECPHCGQPVGMELCACLATPVTPFSHYRVRRPD